MHINHFKAEVGAELEALVSEINELKKRVTELELQNMSSVAKHEYIGHWNHKKIEDKTKVTCNTSELV